MNRRKKVTMADIAAQLGVSIVTVSKALSGKDGVGPELRQDIYKLAGDLGYLHPASQAPTLAAMPAPLEQKNLNIGILVAKHYFQNSNSFYFDLYQMLVKQLMERGHFGIVEIVGSGEEKLAKPPQLLLREHVAGVIVLGQFSSAYLKVLHAHQIPMIFVDFSYPDFDEDAIVQDNITGGFLATEHLILQGHKEIAYVGSISRTTSILDRYLGYHKALLTYGLSSHYEYVIDDRDQAGIFIEMVLPEKMPTAIFCNSDETAYMLMKMLEERHIRVPDDISIVGFDDSIYAKMTTPPLTTVAVDREAMTDFAVRDILRKIEKEDDEWMHMRKVIKVHLCRRDSVKTLPK